MTEEEQENLDIEFDDPDLMKEVSHYEFDDDEIDWLRAHDGKWIPDDPKDRREFYEYIFARLQEHPEWSLDTASRRLTMSEGQVTALIMHFYQICDWHPGDGRYEWLDDAIEYEDLRWAFEHPGSEPGLLRLHWRLRALRLAMRKLTEEREEK